MKKLKVQNPNYEAWKKIRGTWGAVNPVTKVVPNKKKKGNSKYPKQDMEKGM